MKRIALLIVTIALTAGLVGCTSNKTARSNATTGSEVAQNRTNNGTTDNSTIMDKNGNGTKESGVLGVNDNNGINYLKDKDIRQSLNDLYNPSAIVKDMDEKVEVGKITSAIHDALNRGVYSPTNGTVNK